jgi:site-specific recombinase XerC
MSGPLSSTARGSGQPASVIPTPALALLGSRTIRPHDVATYIEQLQNEVAAPSVKQQLAAVRMLFDWLVIGQVVPANPAAAVRGPKHVVKTGKDAGARRRRMAQAA